MSKRTSIVLFMAAIVVLVATWAMLGEAAAQKAAVPKLQEKLRLGEEEVKQMLLSDTPCIRAANKQDNELKQQLR